MDCCFFAGHFAPCNLVSGESRFTLTISVSREEIGYSQGIWPSAACETTAWGRADAPWLPRIWMIITRVGDTPGLREIARHTTQTFMVEHAPKAGFCFIFGFDVIETRSLANHSSLQTCPPLSILSILGYWTLDFKYAKHPSMFPDNHKYPVVNMPALSHDWRPIYCELVDS